MISGILGSFLCFVFSHFFNITNNHFKKIICRKEIVRIMTSTFLHMHVIVERRIAGLVDCLHKYAKFLTMFIVFLCIRLFFSLLF